MPKEHWSDCAIYREPAYPAADCNCGAPDLALGEGALVLNDDEVRAVFGAIALVIGLNAVAPDQKTILESLAKKMVKHRHG